VAERSFRERDLVRVTKGAFAGRTGRVEAVGLESVLVRVSRSYRRAPLLLLFEEVTRLLPREARPLSVGALQHPERSARLG
jgi:transcription antitermination factor NusG